MLNTGKLLARKVGFDICGITPCKHLVVNERAYRDWLAKGYDSTLEYMRRNLDKRFNPENLVEGAKSVIVCGVSYKSPISGGYTSEDRTKIASYACNRDYHKSIKKMLQTLLKELQKIYPKLEGRAFVDTAPLLEKQLAVEAGLGWIGKQSLLITPEFGSYVLLGELVINMECDQYDKPLEGVGCSECKRCMESCPAQAIVEPMIINTAKCISCRTIEAEQEETDNNLHGWIFGCDECQNCCPYNKKAKQHTNQHFDPLFDPREIATSEWLEMSEEEFQNRFGFTPMKRAGLERIKKNITGK